MAVFQISFIDLLSLIALMLILLTTLEAPLNLQQSVPLSWRSVISKLLSRFVQPLYDLQVLSDKGDKYPDLLSDFLCDLICTVELRPMEFWGLKQFF